MSMNEREKGFENKYAHDQHKLFKIEARTSKLLGLWAAEKMSLTADEADAYAKEVIASNMDEPGFDDVKAKVLKDFQAKSLDITAHMIDVALEKKFALAADQIENDAK